jgi:hypothetical protein
MPPAHNALTASMHLAQMYFEPILVRLFSVMLAPVFGFQHTQFGDFIIKLHLFGDERVARAQGFDFGIRQGRFVNVVTASYGRFRGHDLRDELLFFLHGLVG